MTTSLLPITSLETVTTEVFRRKFCHKFCHYIDEFCFVMSFRQYMSCFFGELDACFEKEKAKKVRLLLSLFLSLVSQFVAATICQSQKEEEEEKMKKK